MADAIFHVLCRDCRFEAVVEDHAEARERWLTHRQATNDGHDVEYDAIEGAVECEQCGRDRPVDEVEHLVNALSGLRSFVCTDCWHAGAIW